MQVGISEMEVVGQDESIHFVVVFDGIKTQHVIQERKVKLLEADQQEVIPF
jgi:hypothetical protein